MEMVINSQHKAHIMRILLTPAIVFFMVAISSGQGKLPTENIEVIKAYDARLGEAKKLSIQPKLPPIDTNERRYQYDITSQEFQVKYDQPVLRPLAMPQDVPTTSYTHFAKAGLGNINSLYGQAGLSFLNEGVYEFGVKANYQKANNADYEDQRYSEAGAQIQGKYHVSDALAAGGSISYDRNTYFLYGYDHDVILGPNRKNGFKRYQTLQLEANASNPIRTSGGFDYHVSAGLQKRDDRAGHVENTVILKGGGTKWINNELPLSFDVEADLTKFSSGEAETTTLNNIYLRPKFVYRKPKYQIDIGAQLVSSGDEFFFYPDIQAAFKLWENRIIPYIGWNGTVEKNDFIRITDYNPYVLFTPIEMNNQRWNQYYGGLKGEVERIHYNVKFAYRTVKNIALFDQNIVDERRFDITFDDGNIFSISGSLDAKVMKNLSVGAHVYQNFYDLNAQEHPWHLPGFEMNVHARFTGMNNRLIVTPQLNVMDGVRVRDFNQNVDRLGSLLDVSIHADFFVLDQIGVFAHLNNLTANTRARWQQYPSFGRNIIVGVTSRF